ncbi:MAG TPA: cupin domain-containing protein [Candidatus Paceibacterota bacterium]|nr:cupin domain-containing protein [Candidatus Paceibacterota bacterium]
MDLELRIEDRSWDRERHLRHINEGAWLPMLDADGKVLPGIVGKRGVEGDKKDSTKIGADFVKMNPGTKFPLHEHEGEHEIFFISGEGFVHIDGENIPVRAGHVIHIPGEYPHGVWVSENVSEPLIFVAAGHPHKHVDAADRMQHPHAHRHR